MVKAIAALALALAAGVALGQGMDMKKMAARPELGAAAAFGPDGSLYAVVKRGEHVLLYRSGDEGATWSAPSPVNSQPEAIAADGENRPKLAFTKDGRLLVAWTRPGAKPYTGDIRLARGGVGEGFAPPLTVHANRDEITHRFEALAVSPDGRVHVAWIDKRDLEAAKARGETYRGAAIYAAVSDDDGRSFRPEMRVADHSCECCRLAMAIEADGRPLLMWRHVFAANERDHALARLDADGRPQWVARATFDQWRVDACPHHGPSLTIAADGSRHAVWFNQRDGDGRVFYGRLVGEGAALRLADQRPVGGERAAHADIGLAGQRLGIAWKEFDGEKTQLLAEVSADGGKSFRPAVLAETAGASDQPRLIKRGDLLYAFWHTEREGMRLLRLP